MTNKRLIIGLMVTVIAGGLIFGVARKLGEARMPVYQGRTARYWLGEIFTTNQSIALRAFREMGTNALPMLVHEFATKDSIWDRFYQKNYPKLPAVWQKYFSPPMPPETRWGSAALVIMNSRDVRVILPELGEMLTHKDGSANSWILSCLSQRISLRDTNYLPVLIQCLGDTNAFVRRDAAAILGRMGKTASSCYSH